MPDLKGLRVIVAGGGAIGSAIALELAGRGASVTLADPAPVGANASGVAAGMLAPAMEAALDPLSGAHFTLLKTARDQWPGFVERHGLGIELHPCGALWTGGEAAGAALLDRLLGLGAAAEPVDPSAVSALAPGLRPGRASVFTPEDWRLEPMSALAALREAFAAAGGHVRAEAVGGWGRRHPPNTSALVLATGLAPSGWVSSQSLRIRPIKGQALRYPGSRPVGGPILRAPNVYLVPSAAGVIAGATMEAGRSDIGVTAKAVRRLRGAAERLAPSLAGAEFRPVAGIRAGTPDGLPLVGRGDDARPLLALGARRNGWLLAPAIAALVADLLEGGDGGPFSGVFAPSRFDR